MRKIILASGSPRRKEILEQVGLDFEIIPSEKEEIITDKDPVNVVKNLASMKATDIADRIKEPCIILGADTIVVFQNEIMGKPKDERDAKRMIRNLQNNTHEVYTGVSVIIKEYNKFDSSFIGEYTEQSKELISNCDLTSKEILFHELTKVSINPMTEQQIEDYIATKEPFGKAGSYAIQGKFASYVKMIEGDYLNVVGLPIAKIFSTLTNENIDLLR